MIDALPFIAVVFSKILQPVEYEILKDWFEVLISNESCHLDLIGTKCRLINVLSFIYISFVVYLRTSPETCLERIKTRNRPEEHSITLDYLYQLHECHEQWLSPRTRTMTTPVLIIDADQTREHVYSETNTHLINLASC